MSKPITGFSFLLTLLSIPALANNLYTESFTGNGDYDMIGWTSVYNNGSYGAVHNYGWVWHIDICTNLIYTNEYVVDTSTYPNISFSFEHRASQDYGQTPNCSIAVQVDDNWYVSKTVFMAESIIFGTRTFLYDPAKENWDELDISTATRNATATADLNGNITGFGLFSDSQNYGDDCTAEYDNFFIHEIQIERSADLTGDGAVDVQDLSSFVEAWLAASNDPQFNEIYDLDLDAMDIDLNDFNLFAQDWLTGIKYPYSPPPPNRTKQSLNTGWKFYRGEITSDLAKDLAYDDSTWQTVNIPHTPVITSLRIKWPGHGIEDYNWYRKHFMIGSSMQDKKIFFEFEAADQVADIWINGTYLKTHYGSYLPFTVDITDHINFGGVDNVIALKVTEHADPNIPAYGLWVSTGGLYRDVWVHITDKLHVTDAVNADIVAGGGVFVTYLQVSDSLARVQVKTHLKNEYTTAKNCRLESYIVDSNNKVVAEASDTDTIPGSADHTFTQLMSVYQPSLWHPDHPNLYTLYTHVYENDTILDSYHTRIGIRRISFSKTEGFRINGQPMRFRGANRVQDYPYVQWAMGNLGQRRDAELLREAGFNYVRTAHYPPDPAFLDACDEFGILVMDEIPGFQYIGGTLFKNRSYQNMRDMIRRDRNHPCIIAWELSLNETNFGTTYAQTAMDIGHAEYPGDQCYITGWKHDSVYDVYIRASQHGARNYSGNKALIISEHAHWDYGGGNSTSDVHRDDNPTDAYAWGETGMLQQAWNHQESHHRNHGTANMCGDGLWAGIDYGAWPSGVYDFLRLPKFSAYFWQSQRSPDLDLSHLGIDSGPMVFIANYWTSSSPVDVKVYSNCEQVRLYINGSLQATQSPDTAYPTANLLHPPFTFTGLTFQPGELKAEGLIDGQVVAAHIVNTPGTADALRVEFDITDIPANGSETIYVYARVLDAAGTLVPDYSGSVNFSVTGPATLISPADITVEAGIATAFIRVTDQPGQISITATSAALTPDTANISTQ